MQLRNNTNPLQVLQNIIANGGPEKSEYDVLGSAFEQITGDLKSGKINEADVRGLKNSFGEDCLQSTLHGHSITKPFGYAGDFMIIDRIYKEQITTDYRFQKWDIFWNSLAGCRAVRNRKDYFINTITGHLDSKPAMHLLNVASGPARDLFELYQSIQPRKLQTTCVEADDKAISYAGRLTSAYSEQINFIHKNIFRFSATDQYDVVWSAGLFDYFEDALFVKLLRKFIGWTKKGGEVIIGNFSVQNPSRHYMELIGDWYLHHRTETELIQMAISAGASREDIHVGKEMEGVNLFLHVKVR